MAGAAGSGEALAQQPFAAPGLKTDLHLRQAAVQPGTQVVDPAPRCRGLEKQPLVQGFHHGAFAGLIGAPDQGDVGIEAELQVLVLPHLAQHGVTQAHG